LSFLDQSLLVVVEELRFHEAGYADCCIGVLARAKHLRTSHFLISEMLHTVAPTRPGIGNLGSYGRDPRDGMRVVGPGTVMLGSRGEG
jgi:hypothetical protein